MRGDMKRWFVGLLGVVFAHSASAVMIDLNDFFADPTVTVAADGSTAFFEEDPDFFLVSLVNDPWFGDPDVIIPGPDQILSFDYDFMLGGPDDVDEFFAYVLDASTGLSVGSAFEFLVDVTSSGSVSFDLSSLAGLTLGLSFELASLDDFDFGSTLLISNLDISPASTEVPEPGTLGLLFAGLLLGGLSRVRRRAQ